MAVLASVYTHVLSLVCSFRVKQGRDPPAQCLLAGVGVLEDRRRNGWGSLVKRIGVSYPLRYRLKMLFWPMVFPG